MFKKRKLWGNRRVFFNEKGGEFFLCEGSFGFLGEGFGWVRRQHVVA